MFEKDACSNCGSTQWRNWRKRFVDTKEGPVAVEECSDCKGVKPSFFRDAAGNRVLVSDAVAGKYSYAIDAPITSQKQLSEHLKRHNLIQRG